MLTDNLLLAHSPDAVERWVSAHPVGFGFIQIAIGALFISVSFTRYRALGLPDDQRSDRLIYSYWRFVWGLGFIGFGIYCIATNL